MYSSNLYQKALNRLDRRREEDELRTAATLAEVSAKVPRLEEIQNQSRQVGFSISKAFFAKDAKAEIDKAQAESLRLQGEKRSGCWWSPVMRRTLWPTTTSAPPARTPAM